ncbi:MAG: hypothetical protein HYT75_05455 [Deltaproteobacteria bacterium]|nr:hypothetical protein [Deltaproteobacteria bacterium]
MGNPTVTTITPVIRQFVSDFGGTTQLKNLEYNPNLTDIVENCGGADRPRDQAVITDANGDGQPDKVSVCGKDSPLTEEYKNIFNGAKAKAVEKIAAFFKSTDGVSCKWDDRVSQPPNLINVICQRADGTSAQLLDDNGDTVVDKVALFMFGGIDAGVSVSNSVTSYPITPDIKDAAQKLFSSGTIRTTK